MMKTSHAALFLFTAILLFAAFVPLAAQTTSKTPAVKKTQTR